MRFGGHETFAVREGWLHKGLRLLNEAPDRFGDEFEADWLGVGKNMARSIRHWLLGTGLAAPQDGTRSGRRQPLEITPLGQLVWERDRYFGEIGTWWLLHINLVHTPEHAFAWRWFFNAFGHDRFDRGVCVESLKRQLQLTRKRIPSHRTLDRDVACLLSTYARTIPSPDVDPEDGSDCPFRELGLLTNFRSSGYYQLNQAPKSIPPEILGYSMARAFRDVREGSSATEILLQTATREAGSPGRVFVFTAESLFETVSRIEHLCEGAIEITGLAGQRSLRVRQQPALIWLEQYYASLVEGASHAA